MATWYIDQQGAAGSGTSSSDTRTTIPGYSAGDSLLFKYGSTFAFTGQLSITATGTTWGAFGDAALGRPVWTSTATNFGSINVSTASGVTTFQDIEFRNYLSGSADGGVINCAVNGTSTVSSSLKVERCKFQTCAYNAVMFNGTNQASAAVTGEFNDVEWDDIGADCIFGWVVTLTIRRPRATRISTRGVLGDFLGMINGYSATVTVTGPGLVDHSYRDCKQCFIVDASGGTPAGLLDISGLTIIGYGSASVAPVNHTVVISDIPLKFHHNEVDTYGLTVGVNNSGDLITENVFNVGNIGASNVMCAMSANGGAFSRNTVRAMNTLPSTARMVVVANGVSAATVESNFFSGVPIAIKSDAVGYNPTTRNNAYYNVTSPRLDSSSAAYSGTNEVTALAGLRGNYTPYDTTLSALGYYTAGTDFYGQTWPNPPTPGAVQYKLAAAAAANPGFLYDNRLGDGTLTASTTATDYAAANLTDLRPYSFWKPTALPATVTVDCAIALKADYAAICGHDLHTRNCAIEIRASTDNFSASDVLIIRRVPESDAPLVLAFDSAEYRYWRIRIEGSEAPTLAIALIGAAFPIPRQHQLGFDPTARSARSQTNRSVSGYPLGKVTTFEEWAQSVSIDIVTWAWIRDSWIPAWKEWLRDEPFLYAWDSTDHPAEVYLVTAGPDFKTPTITGNYAGLEFTLTGVAT